MSRFWTALRTQAMVPSPPAIRSLHWVSFISEHSWRAISGVWSAKSMAWTALSTFRAADKIWKASLLPDFPFPVNKIKYLESIRWNRNLRNIPMTMRGFQRGPHWGSRILDTTHLDLRLSVTQLGGMMKFRYVPRSHKSDRLGWHFSWTVHWHQQQRRPERSQPVPQSSSQTWQTDSTWIFPWKSNIYLISWWKWIYFKSLIYLWPSDASLKWNLGLLACISAYDLLAWGSHDRWRLHMSHTAYLH